MRIGRIQTCSRVAFVFNFPVEFFFDFFNLLPSRIHQAEIIIVKPFIQGRCKETRLGVEPLTLRSWLS